MRNLVIGYAREDITPPEGVELEGYGYYLERKNTGALDPIYVRAVALESGGVPCLIVDCDLVGIPASMEGRIAGAISEKLGIPAANMLLCCIHTHSGPVTGVLSGCGEPDESYVARLERQIVEAAVRSWEERRPVCEIRVFDEPGESIGINRAVKGGPIDESLRGLLFDREDGRRFALLNHGCHPVSAGKNLRVTADYPGYLVRELAGDGLEAVFLGGFCGDINPARMGSEDRPAENGKRLADFFRQAMAKARPLTDWSLSCAGFDAELALAGYSCAQIEERSRAFAAISPPAARAAGVWAYLNKRRVLDGESHAGRVRARFVRLGDVLLAGYGAEMTIELARLIREAFPGCTVLPMGNLFGTQRYIATESLVNAGGYEGYSHSFAYASMPIRPGAGEKMVRESCRRAREALK